MVRWMQIYEEMHMHTHICMYTHTSHIQREREGEREIHEKYLICLYAHFIRSRNYSTCIGIPTVHSIIMISVKRLMEMGQSSTAHI